MRQQQCSGMTRDISDMNDNIMSVFTMTSHAVLLQTYTSHLIVISIYYFSLLFHARAKQVREAQVKSVGALGDIAIFLMDEWIKVDEIKWI